jgi:hypothetical protein
MTLKTTAKQEKTEDGKRSKKKAPHHHHYKRNNLRRNVPTIEAKKTHTSPLVKHPGRGCSDDRLARRRLQQGRDDDMVVRPPTKVPRSSSSTPPAAAASRAARTPQHRGRTGRCQQLRPTSKVGMDPKHPNCNRLTLLDHNKIDLVLIFYAL